APSDGQVRMMTLVLGDEGDPRRDRERRAEVGKAQGAPQARAVADGLPAGVQLGAEARQLVGCELGGGRSARRAAFVSKWHGASSVAVEARGWVAGGAKV